MSDRTPTSETTPTRYGLCSGTTDLIVGHLFARCTEHPDHLCIVATHLSSSIGWSEHDVRGHHDRQDAEAAFVWLGWVEGSAEAFAALPLPLCTKGMHAALSDEGRHHE